MRDVLDGRSPDEAVARLVAALRRIDDRGDDAVDDRVGDEIVEDVVTAIVDAARSGNESGDGLCWTTPVNGVMHHRTGTPLEELNVEA